MKAFRPRLVAILGAATASVVLLTNPASAADFRVAKNLDVQFTNPAPNYNVNCYTETIVKNSSTTHTLSVYVNCHSAYEGYVGNPVTYFRYTSLLADGTTYASSTYKTPSGVTMGSKTINFSGRLLAIYSYTKTADGVTVGTFTQKFTHSGQYTTATNAVTENANTIAVKTDRTMVPTDRVASTLTNTLASQTVNLSCLNPMGVTYGTTSTSTGGATAYSKCQSSLDKFQSTDSTVRKSGAFVSKTSIYAN